MQKLWVLLLLAAGFAGGYSYRNVGEPYKLDYRRAVVNLLFTFTKHLNNDKYALGEKYLAEDLAAELKKQGIDTRLYTFEDTFSNRNFNEGFEIYMRAGPELRLSIMGHSGVRLCAKDGSGYIDCSDEELAEQLAPFFRELRI